MKLATLLMIGSCTLGCGALLAQAGPNAPPPVELTDSEIAATDARQTALDLAAMLEEGYVFPETGRRYAEALRAKAEAGGYDGAGSVFRLAETLTADLRAVSPDNHLRVMPAPPPGPGGPGPRRVVVRGEGKAAGALRPALPEEAMEEARWIAPGIAYVRFNLFPGAPETVEAARRFVEDHLDARAIVFDIRTHRGGGLAEMDAMFPYLFAEPKLLVTMDTRASVERQFGSPVAGVPTLREVPTGEDVVRREHHVTPHESETRLHDAKIYVLTSGATGSAAEHFALALKRTGRATLVGEATGGAGHFGGIRPVGDKLAVFIPVGRTFDPDTGKGWEGDGVAPHVAVPAERALVEVLVKEGIAPAEAERLSAEVHPQGRMTRRRPAA